MIETEVPPRVSDYLQIADYRLRHPIKYFVCLYCYLFAFGVALNDLQTYFFKGWTLHSHAFWYGMTLFMTIIFYLSDRRKMRSSVAHIEVDPTQLEGRIEDKA